MFVANLEWEVFSVDPAIPSALAEKLNELQAHSWRIATVLRSTADFYEIVAYRQRPMTASYAQA